LKVAIVSPYSLDMPGGVQEQVFQLGTHLRSVGHVAELIGPGHSDGRWTSVGRSTNVTSNDSVAPVCLAPGAISKVKEALIDADVVHIHEPLLPVVGPAAWIGVDKPTVGSFHAEPAAFVRAFYRVGGPLLGPLVRRIGVLTAVSAEAANAVAGFAQGIEIVPNAVDVSGFPHRKRIDHRVAFVGRDDPRKGLDDLLAAWPQVRVAIPDAELVVVGASRADRLEGVVFEGRVQDDRKRELLASSVVYCAPNTGNESFGLSLVEGMSAGCAVVATDLPAFVAVAGEAAEHVPVGDRQALASALIRLLKDRNLAERRGASARRRAATFDWGRVLPRWIAVYEQAMRRGPGRIGT